MQTLEQREKNNIFVEKNIVRYKEVREKKRERKRQERKQKRYRVEEKRS